MLVAGTRLGPYEIAGLIGEGGMGQVYQARDTRLDRTVAVKMLPAALAADAVRRERFEREARSVSRLEHPNICPLYDVGELFYLGSGGRLIAVPVLGTEGAFRTGSQTELFRATLYAEAYTPDRTGDRFLIARPAATAETVPLEVVTNPLSAPGFQR